MYDIGDPDLAKSYDPKKVASAMRTPKFPDVDSGTCDCVLKRVKKDRAPNAGNLYEFKFSVTKSGSELVSEGATYTVAFFPGASDVKNAIFWEKITPILRAAAGHTGPLETFNAMDQLGEFKSLCDADPALELGLAFRMTRKMEQARKGKDGTYKPNHLNADGTPKWFANDTYLHAVVAPA